MLFKKKKTGFDPESLCREIEEISEKLFAVEKLYLSRAEKEEGNDHTLAADSVRKSREELERCISELSITLPPKDERRATVYAREQARILAEIMKAYKNRSVPSVTEWDGVYALALELSEKQRELATV